jgi:hypothetical protein
MHRRHVINTLRKHLNNFLVMGYQTGNSFCMYDPALKKSEKNADTVYSVRVGVLNLTVTLIGGATFTIPVQHLASMKFTAKNMLLNGGGIRFALRGTAECLTT